MSQAVTFKQAFRYPFKRPVGMLNILWILLPIIGWFALGGYCVRIVKEFIEGKFTQLPTFSFSSDLKLGFFMFLKAIPFALAYFVLLWVLQAIDDNFASAIQFILELFVLPILAINFYRKETIESYFDFSQLKSVTKHLGDYFMALLKGLGLGIIFVIMILVLVGLPALAFTGYIFYADFYRRYNVGVKEASAEAVVAKKVVAKKAAKKAPAKKTTKKSTKKTTKKSAKKASKSKK